MTKICHLRVLTEHNSSFIASAHKWNDRADKLANLGKNSECVQCHYYAHPCYFLPYLETRRNREDSEIAVKGISIGLNTDSLQVGSSACESKKIAQGIILMTHN